MAENTKKKKCYCSPYKALTIDNTPTLTPD